MKLYRLPIVVYPPTDGSEGRYLAEVPTLDGCYGWGDTPGEAMMDCECIAKEVLAKRLANGDPLPEQTLLDIASISERLVRSEVIVEVEALSA